MGKLNIGQRVSRPGNIMQLPPGPPGEIMSWPPWPRVLYTARCISPPRQISNSLAIERERGLMSWASGLYRGTPGLGLQVSRMAGPRLAGREKTEGVRSGPDIRQLHPPYLSLSRPPIINIQLWNSFKTRPTFKSPLCSLIITLCFIYGHANRSSMTKLHIMSSTSN